MRWQGEGRQAPINLEAGSDAAMATEYAPLLDSEPELARCAVRRGLRLGDTMRASAIEGLRQRFMSASPCSLRPQGRAETPECKRHCKGLLSEEKAPPAFLRRPSRGCRPRSPRQRYPSPCRDACPDRAPRRQVAAGGGVRLGGGAKCCLTFLYVILDDAEVFTVFKDDEADDD